MPYISFMMRETTSVAGMNLTSSQIRAGTDHPAS
jgi:hypothetical protein